MFLFLVNAGFEDADIRQVAVFFVVIQAIAHHELIRHLETLVIRLDISLAAAGFVQDGA